MLDTTWKLTKNNFTILTPQNVGFIIIGVL